MLDNTPLTVEDGSELPVAVGRSGVWINYEGAITEPDVFTKNGVIHFINSVIQDAPSVARVQVFVTSADYNGNLGNQLEGADAKCSSVASHVNLPGTWTAWLSDDAGNNARDRIQDGEYQLLDGTVVATSLDELTDGLLDHPINIDENGSLLDGVPVFTGTNLNGFLEGDTCSSDSGSWKRQEDENKGQVGDSSMVDGRWTSADVSGCQGPGHLYCFADAVTESGNEPPLDANLPEVCGSEWCAADDELMYKCVAFLDHCLTEIGVLDEQCIAAAYFICHNDL